VRALPGAACVDSDFHELLEAHPSRRMTISERNWRNQQGWQPPELAGREKQEAALSTLFGLRIRSKAKAVGKVLNRRSQISS